MLLTKRFADALIYAFRLHGGQKRKGTSARVISTGVQIGRRRDKIPDSAPWPRIPL